MAAGLFVHPAPAGTRPAVVFSPQDRSSGQVSADAAKILIVEDDFLAASEIEAVLMEAGYQIAGIANRAEEALRLVETGRVVGRAALILD